MQSKGNFSFFNYLNSRTTRLKSKNKFILFSRKLVVNINDSITLSNSLVNVSFSNGNLVLILLLVFSKLGALEVGLDGQPQLHPQPGLGDHEGSDGSLAGIESKFLILKLLELHSGTLSSCSSLKP